MTTESQVDVFTSSERINLLVQFTGQAMQGLLASKPSPGNVAELAVIHALDLVAELEDHFRKEYAAKAAELRERQAAVSAPRIITGGFTQ